MTHRRKKWERSWDQVKFCSDRCRSASKGSGGGGSPPTGTDAAAADDGSSGSGKKGKR